MQKSYFDVASSFGHTTRKVSFDSRGSFYHLAIYLVGRGQISANYETKPETKTIIPTATVFNIKIPEDQQ